MNLIGGRRARLDETALAGILVTRRWRPIEGTWLRLASLPSNARERCAQQYTVADACFAHAVESANDNLEAFMRLWKNELR